MFVSVSGDFNHNRSAMKKKALAQGPLSMWDHFDKIAEIGLKPALLEKHWLEAIIMTCKLSLAQWFSTFFMQRPTLQPQTQQYCNGDNHTWNNFEWKNWLSFLPGDPIILATTKVVQYTKYKIYKKLWMFWSKVLASPEKRQTTLRLKTTGSSCLVGLLPITRA